MTSDEYEAIKAWLIFMATTDGHGTMMWFWEGLSIPLIF